MTNNDELLDLVDKNDQIVGTIWRSETTNLAENGRGYIRAVEMFIVNDIGELWIPKRTADKRIAPNGLDFSAAGHVSSGETYIEAMLKEIREELNLVLAPTDLEFVANIGPDENSYFRRMFAYRTNQVPVYNPKDFTSAEWVKPIDLLAKLDSGVPAKSTLRGAVALLEQWLTSVKD